MAGGFGGRQRTQGNNAALLGGLALVFVVILLLLIYMFVNSQKEVAAPQVQQPVQAEAAPVVEKQVTVLVPLQDIQQGVQLQPSMFKKISKPESAVDERAIRDFEGINMMYSKTLLVANAPVMQEYVQNTKPVVAIPIPPGFRAVTIRVNATSSVEGWARAGSKVDVNWISIIHGKRCLTTIVQCAKVVSAERQTTNNTPQGAAVPSTITLVVNSSDAKKIQLAEAGQGQLSLDLRGDDTACVVDDKRGTYCEGDSNVEKDNKPKVCTNVVIVDGRKWCFDRSGLTPLSEDADE